MKSNLSINIDDVNQVPPSVYGRWWCYYPSKAETMHNPGYDYPLDVLNSLIELGYEIIDTTEDVEKHGNVVDVYTLYRESDGSEAVVTAYERDQYYWSHIELYGYGEEAVAMRKQLKGW